MARLRYLTFFLFLIVQFLSTTSHAYYHRHNGHLRRTLGYHDHGKKAWYPRSLELDATQEKMNEMKVELAAKTSLRDSIIHLLDREALSGLWTGAIDDEDDKTIKERADGDHLSLEELQQRLDELNEMLQALSNLLLSFGIQPQPTRSSNVAVSTTPTIMPYPLTSSMPMSSPAPTQVVSNSSMAATSTSNSTILTSSLEASPSVTATSTSSPYSFNADSSSNVVVYYGQTDQTSSVSISTICADPNVDIIILAFIHKLSTGPASYPGLNLGAKCWAANSAQVSAGATGLIDCVSDGFAAQIKSCQSTGKKILLSIGGAAGYSETTIASEQDAVRIADNIWNLFGAGGLNDITIKAIRPFGDFVVDGFDIDNEDHSTLYWPTLISTLRTHFLDYSPVSSSGNSSATITNKLYFLSAAPQCPRPDESIPLISMQTQIDYIFVQFYNNPACNLNSAGFKSSLQAWSNDLLSQPPSNSSSSSLPPSSSSFIQTGNGVTKPLLFIGAPAFPAAGSGWVAGQSFLNIMADLPALGLPNIGGAMFWDGAYGILSGGDEVYGNTGLGRTYMELAKEVLG